MARLLRLGVYRVKHKMIKAYDLERSILGFCPLDMYRGNYSWKCHGDGPGCRIWAQYDPAHGSSCVWRFIERYIVRPDAKRG